MVTEEEAEIARDRFSIIFNVDGGDEVVEALEKVERRVVVRLGK